jgi:PAS domain S-box-containing protein
MMAQAQVLTGDSTDRDVGRRRLLAIVQSASDAMFTKSLDGTITSWNRGAERMYGYGAAEAIGQSVNMLVPGDSSAEVDGILAHIARGESYEQLERVRVCKSGAMIDVSLTITPMWDTNGTVIGVSTIGHDITQRNVLEVELERALQAEEQLGVYAEIVHDMQIGLQVWRLDDPRDPGSLRLIAVNPASSMLSGTDLGADVGRTMREIFPPLMATTLPTLCAQVACSGEAQEVSEFAYDDEREGRDSFSIKAFPLPNRSVGILFENITERKCLQDQIRDLNIELEARVVRRTAELVAANEQLSVLNEELESFAYSVSHDLRSPLRGIDGFSKIVVAQYADVLDDEGKRYLQRVCAATQRMSQLIDDLLKLSRVSRAEFRDQTVDLTAIATEIADELAAADPGRHVTFVIGSDMTLRGDRTLMRAALENLLNNAWKFTSKHPTAMIEVGVTDHGGERVYFVRDDGVGFDMAYAGNLFGAFQRMHSLREFEGTGIGLATVRRIITRHGGRVWADAAIERGATVSFTVRGA